MRSAPGLELALGLATLLPIPIFLAFVIVLITGSPGMANSRSFLRC